MESFLCLFDPGDCALDSLPPEPELGNVEYKLKLVNPSRSRFEHLVTQMKWRLREGQGEAIYEIGVSDSGSLTGLSEDEMAASMDTLTEMAKTLGATITVLRERTVDGGLRTAAEVLVRKVPDDQASIDLRVAVMGNADVGKSTLLGVLTQGQLDNGRGRARLNMFRHLHEIQSGRTSSISHEILGFNSQGRVVNYSECSTAEEIVENSSKLITFLDLAGHHKYMKTTIYGLLGYCPHYILLVIGANTGVSGTAREHLSLALALEVPLCVIVTKTDLVPRHVLGRTLEELKTVLMGPGINRVPLIISNEDDVINAGSTKAFESVVPIFTVSSVTGVGLDMLEKYLHVLPPLINSKERERLEQEPVEFQIDDMWHLQECGVVVGGLLTKGCLLEGQTLLLGPQDDGSWEPVRVQSIQRNRAPCRIVRASQSAALALGHPNVQKVRKGMLLLPVDAEPESCIYFQATINVIHHDTTIHPGFQTTVHIGNVRQTAVIEGMMSPKGLCTNQKSSVLFRFIKQPECISPGTRLFFRDGRTKGIGKVVQVFPYEPR